MPNIMYEEEIDIKNCLRIIIKKKMIVLCIFLAIVLPAAVIIHFLPKTYEVQALVQRGSLNGPVLNYQETVAILKSKSFMKPILKKLGVDPLKEEEIQEKILLENVKETNFLIIKVRLQDNDLCYLLTQEIANAYIEYGNSTYYIQHNLLTDYFSQIKILIETTKLGIDKNMFVKKETVLPLALPDDKVQLKDLLSQKFQIENQLAIAKEFKLIDAPVKSKYPVSSKKILLLTGSCILGLMLGVFAAVSIESRKKPD